MCKSLLRWFRCFCNGHEWAPVVKGPVYREVQVCGVCGRLRSRIKLGGIRIWVYGNWWVDDNGRFKAASTAAVPPDGEAG